MKRTFRLFLSLLLLVLLFISMALPAFAANGIELNFKKSIFSFDKTSEYTESDFFGNFKNVMPGDELTETITLNNIAWSCDFIEIYMKLVPHGDADKLLSQLDMSVVSGDTTLFKGSPAEGMAEDVFIAKLRNGQSVKLDLALVVPTTLGNEYANKLGEVDIIFTVDYYPSELIATGQLNWPIPVLGGLGVLLIIYGLVLVRRRRKSSDA